jgi:hypothetical protein
LIFIRPQNDAKKSANCRTNATSVKRTVAV